MSKRERHDSDRRDRRDGQPEDEQQRRLGGDSDIQEGDSLTALKAILAKVAALLNPLHLNAEESIRLVEELYGKVLETDLQLAGETDDTRKSSVLAAIQNATIRREGEKVVVEYASVEKPTGGKPEATDDKPEAANGKREAPDGKRETIDGKPEPAPAKADNERARSRAAKGPSEPERAEATESKPAPAEDTRAETTPAEQEPAS